MLLACVRCTVGGNQGRFQCLTNRHWCPHLELSREAHQLDVCEHACAHAWGLAPLVWLSRCVLGTRRLHVPLVSALLGLNLVTAKQGRSQQQTYSAGTTYSTVQYCTTVDPPHSRKKDQISTGMELNVVGGP